MAGGDLQLSQAVLLQREVSWHPALLLDATAKWYTDKVALQVVRPLVVGTHELGGMTEVRLTELDTAMCAAILDDVEATSLIAHHDHRLIADDGALEAGRRRDRGSKLHVGAAAPAEDPLLLALIDLCV